MATTEELLAKTPLFADATADELANLAKQSGKIALAAKQNLFSRGDLGTQVYVLVDGAIRITVLSEEGREVLFALIEPGQIFGEIAVLDGGPRTASATAMAMSKLISIDRPHLYWFLDRKPARYGRLISVLCQRIRSADELLEDLLFLSARSRLAKHLRSLGDKIGIWDGDSVTIRLSQQDLADNLGVSRELINKILSKWESSGSVSLWRGQISFTMDSELEDEEG